MNFNAGRLAKRIGVAAQWTAHATEAKIPSRSFQFSIDLGPIRSSGNSWLVSAFIVPPLYTNEFYLQSYCGNVLFKTMEVSNSDSTAPLEHHRLAENVGILKEQIAEACKKSGRTPDQVTLIAVTKTVGSPTCNDLASLGCLDLAENRPQVLWEKAPAVNPSVRWHFIGHLQRNKVARTLPLLHTVHSLDSMRLAEQLVKDSHAASLSNQAAHRLNVLLELNITQDQSKTGMSPEQAQELIVRYASTPQWQEHLNLCGLMGMSSLQGDDSQTHQEFETLRTLRDRWQGIYGVSLKELSMGMSDDFRIAIEEGSTMVRIGSLLYR